ncbi:MAG: PAS domain S-box protein [Deltaproteobacteria bacterium]|nr:PAS domain S-box protein [Deltaproteobacteria bacterium]
MTTRQDGGGRRSLGRVVSDISIDTVLGAINETLYVFDPETGRPLFWNAALSAISGYSDEELAEMPGASSAFYSDEDVEKLKGALREIYEEGQTRVEAMLRTKDGRGVLFSYDAVLIQDHEGRPAICVLGRDVSAERAAERALAESEAKFRMMAEQSLFGLAVIQDQKVVFANAEVAHINGYSVEEMMAWEAREFAKAVHPEDRAFAVEQARKKQANEAGARTHYSYRILNKQGETRWVDQYSRTVIHGGRPADLICLVDVTAERRAEETQAQLREQLHHSQKMEAVGRLAGGIAHDVNNILGSILMLAECMGQQTLLEPSVREDLSRIVSLCERGGKLTRDLLGYARKGKHVGTQTALAPIVEEVADLVRRATPKTITTTVEIQEEGIEVFGDPDQLTSALMNVLVNAVDAVPGGGSITVQLTKVKLEPGHPALARGLETGTYASIAVRDSGAGIPADLLEKVTEPFFTTKAMGKGTGLGLSMVDGVARNHGGALLIESQLDEGTRVTILLPSSAVARAGAGDRPASRRPPVRPAGGAILVAEDEQFLRESLHAHLETLGFEVYDAADGQEAVDLCRLRKGDFVAVLLDLVMPRLDGIEAFELIHSRHPDLPVVLMSGHTVEGKPDELLQAGAVGFLQKPFTLDELIRALNTVVPV